MRPPDRGAMEAGMQFGTGIRQLSSRELGLLGIEHVAYVKPVLVEGVLAFAVHAADGSQLAVVVDRAAAQGLVRSHGLEPVSVH
jgi:hypothetical protein